MSKVWLAQCLCPQRHAILAAAGEADSQEAADEGLIAPLRVQVTRMIGSGTINPWCGLCKAPRTTWKYELGCTRFRSMDEAMPELKRLQAEQAVTRRAFDLGDANG
jgi:hypothetical protein